LLIRFALVVLGLFGVAALVCVETATPEAHATGNKKKPKPGKGTRHGRRAPAASASARPIERTRPYATCPAEMVSVRGEFCIDRYEASMVDVAEGRALTPYYPPNPRLLTWVLNTWATSLARDRAVAFGWIDAAAPDAAKGRDAAGAQLVAVSWEPEAGVTIWEGGVPEGSTPTRAQVDGGPAVLALGVVMDLPEVPPWQRNVPFSAMAVSRAAVVPQGSTPGFVAPAACRAAGKRLCREPEWVTACKGDKGTKYPYGDQYRHGACNVFRSDHPARVLHGNASEGLSDPRLNQVVLENAAMLRETGGSPLCKSVWGNDAIYDMVGNLDEWVDDPEGMFLGGFYSRATRNGCEARITAHPLAYFDYSLGVRCCADLATGMSRLPLEQAADESSRP
jgi:hypothetical protein